MENEILSEIRKLSTKVDTIDKKVEKELDTIKSDLNVVKASTLTMETEHSKKLQVLLDIYVPIFTNHTDLKIQLAEFQRTLDTHSIEIDYLKSKIA